MTAELYSTTPPTEDGWYWVQDDDGWEYPCRLHGGKWLWAIITPGMKFGPRIPTAEEIVSMRETLELFWRDLAKRANGER